MTPEHGPDQSELETLPEYLPIRRALLSVSDKDGIVEFARQLHEEGIELISTGGTKRAIEAEGIPVTAVEEVTNFPEMLDGRVKTLDPHVFAGILADRRLADHMETIA